MQGQNRSIVRLLYKFVAETNLVMPLRFSVFEVRSLQTEAHLMAHHCIQPFHGTLVQ